jgi:hypothetical protein
MKKIKNHSLVVKIVRELIQRQKAQGEVKAEAMQTKVTMQKK